MVRCAKTSCDRGFGLAYAVSVNLFHVQIRVRGRADRCMNADDVDSLLLEMKTFWTTNTW